MAVHNCNTTTLEVEAGDCCEFEANLGYMNYTRHSLV